MNSGYTFDQFVQAAIGSDQSSPAYYQQGPQHSHQVQHPAVTTLSPLAPTFHPGVPPPNMIPPHGLPQFPQQNLQPSGPPPSAANPPQFPQQHLHLSGPPPAPSGNVQNLNGAQQPSLNFQNKAYPQQQPSHRDAYPQQQPSHRDVNPHQQPSHRDAFPQQQPSHRGSYEYHRGGQSRGRGQGSQRGRGGSQGQGQGQFWHPPPPNGRGGYQSPSHNSSGARPRQQQHSRQSERHSGDDYGDMFNNHAELNNGNPRNNRNGVSSQNNAELNSGNPRNNRNGVSSQNNAELNSGNPRNNRNGVSSQSNAVLNSGNPRNNRNAASQNSAEPNSGSQRSYRNGASSQSFQNDSTSNEERGDSSGRNKNGKRADQYNGRVNGNNQPQNQNMSRGEKRGAKGGSRREGGEGTSQDARGDSRSEPRSAKGGFRSEGGEGTSQDARGESRSEPRSARGGFRSEGREGMSQYLRGDFRGEARSARGARGGFRSEGGEGTSQDYARGDSRGETRSARGGSRSEGREGMSQDPASRGDSSGAGSRNGGRSAPAGRGKASGGNSAGDSRPEEGADRRVQMEDQLKRGRYECMVCCDNIRQEIAVWSCQKCYHVYHLRCIKQWFKTSLNDPDKGNDGTWRCPACQNSNQTPPNGYRCFCGKMRDPVFQPGETPHSCGEVCRRKGKEGCTHKCTLLCHPGPCPPCNAVVQRTCDCGAEKKSMRCGQIVAIKCEKVCDKDLNCGKHKCPTVCHEGDCSPCQVSFQQECYGGHKEREVVCGSMEDIEVSFSCRRPCSKTLGCDNHVCESMCHPGACDVCSLLPTQVTNCCCGQTPLSKLTADPRTNCLDPLPTCQLVCSKPMPCGPPDLPHFCDKNCHEGPCDQCEGVTTLTCVCGANQKDFACRELDQFTGAEPFKCERRCNKKRMCGRHKCNELCCTRDIHICEVVCGRPLSCGLHKCEQLCHRGNCRSCLQASFEELTCRCGAEVMYPPIPCGAKPPICNRTCSRQHPCDHPVRHNCHGEEECAPCAQLVHKWCVGEHEHRKNVPCYLTEITCGRPCGKPLPCGQHKCIKTCHKGLCSPEDNAKCEQPCPKKRRDCSHPCGAPCHPDTEACPRTSCKAQIEIKCGCEQRTAKVQCQAGSNQSAEIAQFQRMTVQAMASSGPGQEVDISQLTVQKKNTSRQLECDSSCALLERNRRMAAALDIQNPELDSKLARPKYSDYLKECAKKYPLFTAKAEKNFADLVQNAKQSKHPNRSFAFPSMNRDQRRLVHELAEAYCCDTQSYDYEPNKNVVATAHRSRCTLPSVTLTAFVSQRRGPPPIQSNQPVSAWGTTTKLTSALFKDKDKNKEKPDIDYFDLSSN